MTDLSIYISRLVHLAVVNRSSDLSSSVTTSYHIRTACWIPEKKRLTTRIFEEQTALQQSPELTHKHYRPQVGNDTVDESNEAPMSTMSFGKPTDVLAKGEETICPSPSSLLLG